MQNMELIRAQGEDDHEISLMGPLAHGVSSGGSRPAAGSRTFRSVGTLGL